MRKILIAVACVALALGGLEAKREDDECRHDRQYRGHYRGDNDRYEHKHHGRAEGLPPGLERQLERNGHLPPGLEKKMYPVPEVVCRRLPPLPEGCARGYYGGHVIVYNLHTSVILDVFAGISVGR
ncbi:MAG TPA: hypothetical protein VMT32_12165 [Bryobacteraceae bacterium]|nr:hypothetical protein [Bryobacteraceae bacterium]